MAIIGLGVFSLSFFSPAVQLASASTYSWTAGAAYGVWNTTSVNWGPEGGQANQAQPWNSANGQYITAEFRTSGATADATGNSLAMYSVNLLAPGVSITGGTLNIYNGNSSGNNGLRDAATTAGTDTISSAILFNNVYNSGSADYAYTTTNSSGVYLNLTGPISVSSGTLIVNPNGPSPETGTGSTIALSYSNNSFNVLQSGGHGNILIPSGGSVTCGLFAQSTFCVLVDNGNFNATTMYSTNNNPSNYITGSGTISTANWILANQYTSGGGSAGIGPSFYPFTGSLIVSGTFGLGLGGSVVGYSGVGGGKVLTQSSGTVQLNGSGDSVLIGCTYNNGTTSAGNSTYNMAGGFLSIPNAPLELGYGVAAGGYTSTYNQTGGLANMYGISMGTTQFNGSQPGNCAVSVTGGTLNLGAGGINEGSAGTYAVTFGNVTIGAQAPWSTPAAQTITLNNNTTATFNTNGGTNSITLAGQLTGGGALTATGGGTLLLDAANTYTGPTTISAGTLALIAPSGSLGTGNVSLSGGVLDTSSYAASGGTLFGATSASGGTLYGGRTISPATDVNGNVTLQNTTISLATGGTLTIAGNLTFNGSGNVFNYALGDLVNTTTGDLFFNTGSSISVFPSGGSIAQGTYTLFTYSGVDPSASDFQMASSFQSGTRQTYAFSATSGAVTLSVSGAPAANLVWNTPGSGNWDVHTSQSWYNLGTSASDYFYNSDNATFTDSPPGGPLGGSVSVAVSGTVLPGSITVSNTNVAYTFSNTYNGNINGGASLIKSGPGTLTINTANGYTGGTTLYAGLLNLGNSAALGTGVLTINGGSLDNTSGGPLTLANNIPQNWNANFTFVGTAPLNTGGGTVTLGTTPTVTVSGSTLTVGGPISGPYGLTLSGSGWLNLSSTNAYTGNTTISSGVLQAGTSNPLPYGAGSGNLVFSGSVQPAVLDLNGNNVAINGLSQPSVTSQSVVLNNSPSSQAVLSVGSSGNTSTFGGVLADNTNGLGGTLALAVSGGLTLTNTNTYSGTTAINNGGTLALGTGAAGHDGQLANTSEIDIDNSGTLVVKNAGPTTLAPINASPQNLYGALVQNSASTLTLTGQNYLKSLTVNTTGISGGTINLAGGSSLTNSNASSAWTLSSAVNFPGSTAITWNLGSGTMDIEAPVTDNNYAQLTFISTQHYNYATIELGNSGSISVNGNALDLDTYGAGYTTTNLVQNGGLISLNNPYSYGMYFAQSNGVAYYTMNGGTISATPGTLVALANGPSTQGYFTINGPQAVAKFPSLSLDAGASGSGIGWVALVNGTLAVDNISTMSSVGASSPGYSGINLSGGTLQPLDGYAQWGSSSYAFIVYLYGTGATISSNDLSGNAQNVSFYANLSGTGDITFAGSGVTTLFGGTVVTGSTYSAYHTGATFVTGGGTLQLANPGGQPNNLNPPGGLGSGPLTITGATVDLYGMSSTVGALSGDSSALITNSLAAAGTLTVNSPQGTSTTYAGTIADGGPFAAVGLTLTGGGTLYLTGTGMYTGGTTVSGGELIVTSPLAIDALGEGTTNLSVGTDLGAFLGTVEPAAHSAAAGVASAVPEPGTLALAAAAALVLLRRRRHTTNVECRMSKE